MFSLAPRRSSKQICLILCAVWSLREDQHSLVLAALCAAFPPRRRPGDWVVQADLAEGFLEAGLTALKETIERGVTYLGSL